MDVEMDKEVEIVDVAAVAAVNHLARKRIFLYINTK